jgi:hypothetical protein
VGVHGIAPPKTILIWAHDPAIADALVQEVTEPGRSVHVLADDAELATSGSSGSLLVAQAGPRLEAQQAFLRGPLILLEHSSRSSSALARRAYAVVVNSPEAGLAVDRFLTHRHLAEQAASHRGPPRRCARCGRGFDGSKVRGAGTARRFVRFGSIALCGSCVESLRTLLRQAESAVVDADT